MWLECWDYSDDRARLRRDAAARVDTLMRCLTRNLWIEWDRPDPRPGPDSLPGWDPLVRATGMSRRTLARWLAWLVECGWLLRIERGSTPTFRPMALTLQGNRRAVYRLAVPEGQERRSAAADPYVSTSVPADVRASEQFPVDTTGTPRYSPRNDLSRTEGGPFARTYTRESDPGRRGRPGAQPGPLRGPGNEAWRDLTREVPTTRGAMLAAAMCGRSINPVLRRLSARHVRSLLRPWWRAGWTLRELVTALDTQPDGTPWPYAFDAHELRSPAGWIRYRLSFWTTDTGHPAPSPAARSRAAGEHLAAAQERVRADRAAQRSEAAGADTRTAARAALAAHLADQRARRDGAARGSRC